VTWKKFKDVFPHRFRDTHIDQLHFMRLHTARQSRNESIQEFADRCRALAQKIFCRVDEPVVQRIHYENADGMLLASFVAGLSGIPGRQVRFSNPQSLDQVLKRRCPYKKRKSRKSLARAFTLASIIRSEYVRLARHDVRTTGRIPQLTRGMRQLKRDVSVIKHHVASTSQRPLEVGKPRPKLHLYAMSVRELDTSRESVQHG